MLDFVMVATRSVKRGVTEIYPKFIAKSSEDLMIRGRDFYAIWDEKNSVWSTDEETALRLIDEELDKFFNEHKDSYSDTQIKVLHMWDCDSGSVDRWHKYCQKQAWDNYHALDEKLIFSNSTTTKHDYASKRLPYPLEYMETPAYDELISTLYSEEEREKIEWAIGAIVSGESKTIQKFLVMYGAAGTGKSTVLNIIQMLFDGYYSVFDAKALGSASNVFALEAFKTNPLVAIQHDGDLSRIEDNTRLNSVVSHELMTVNEKFKSTYSARFNAFLLMGTNKPVRITDAKSGVIRRLIDVSPTGEKVPPKRYKELMHRIKFELPGIAWHCKEVFETDPGMYDNYIPTTMFSTTNDFYNYILDNYDVFKMHDSTTLKVAWELYKQYCENAKVVNSLPYRSFREELKNYFVEYIERYTDENGKRTRSLYRGFCADKFEEVAEVEETKPKTMALDCTKSVLDDMLKDCVAQYAKEDGTPATYWDNAHTTLSDIDTSKEHYVRVPENHIVVDFDLKVDGKKSRERNLEEASKWPPTYTEYSKGGNGVHLHYIYDGDVTKLSRIYAPDIEIKVFLSSGKSALRRRVSFCNDNVVTHISTGLPLKKETKMVDIKQIKSEKSLRTLILRNLNKEIHSSTTSSVDFIKEILDGAYDSGLKYDVSDMRRSIWRFANNSTNQAPKCIKQVSLMHFTSKDFESSNIPTEDDSLWFYDVEVFPNLLLVCLKKQGYDNRVIDYFNPTPRQIEDIISRNLIGFNCRRYDNHILYAAMLGYSNKDIYQVSQNIINGESNCFFGEAYNISFTDVYDFCSKKQSLKKWEIELGIHHQELGLPWDKDVPEHMWNTVASYCHNDVIATEAVFVARQGDFTARKILASLANKTPNDTTNSLTTAIIFEGNRNPQSSFNYRDLAAECNDKPYFPGYSYSFGKSIYRGEEVGEGGYVYAEPGIYHKVVTFDVASMHPSSVIAENLFGDIYTKRFKDILDARIAIKHKDFAKARTMLNGRLAPYLDDESQAKTLANALKIAINSVYGLTAAKFDNPFRDPRNVDNIVAKRGALFMIDLKYEVQKRGFTVVHVKTDSIKIEDPTPEVEEFVVEFGKKYGYNFEIEHIFERICLVNDAVYIAKLADNDPESPGEWTATGAQFAVPYIFKTLFSKEEITFDDLCETKSVSTSIYLDRNEHNLTNFLEDMHKLDIPVPKDYYTNVKLDEYLTKKAPDYVDRKVLDSLHSYIFVGKVGRFTPVTIGSNGGLLYREKDGKYYAVGGTKGYRWYESEMIKELGLMDCIDYSYFNSMVDDAVAKISEFGDFDDFVA